MTVMAAPVIAVITESSNREVASTPFMAVTAGCLGCYVLEVVAVNA